MTDSSTERETLHLNGAKAIPIDLTLAGPMADLTIVTQNEANRTVFVRPPFPLLFLNICGRLSVPPPRDHLNAPRRALAG